MRQALSASVVVLAGLSLAGCGRFHFDLIDQPDSGVARDLGAIVDLGGSTDLGTPDDLGTFVPQEGCADQQREGFVDDALYPDIAGCSGAFDQPGVLAAMVPACGGSGDDHPTNADGVGCNVADLCATGWHVCSSSADIVASGAATCVDAAPGPQLFFAARVSGGGNGSCFEGPANDVFGCGSLGSTAVQAACQPVNRLLSDGCMDDPTATWVCPGGADEADLVVHVDASTGGALCCRD